MKTKEIELEDLLKAKKELEEEIKLTEIHLKRIKKLIKEIEDGESDIDNMWKKWSR